MMQKFRDMNRWLQFGLSAAVAAVLLFAMVFEVSIPLPVFEEPAPAAPVVGISAQAVRERIAVDTHDDSYFYNGADLIGYSDDHSTQTWALDTSAGSLTVSTLVTETTDLSLTGSLTVASTSKLDGAVDINAAVAIDGGLVNIGGASGDVADGDNDLLVTGVLEVDGECELDGALDADSTADFASTVAVGGMTTLTGGATGVINTESVMFPTVLSVPITYTAAAGGSGTVATIGDGEIWLIHAVIIDVTTSFDCTGDDATLDIGDGNDADGFLDLADGQLQAADTEGTGFPAGWQGMTSAIVGAYLDANDNLFVYAPSGAAETIDWALDETEGETFDAGAATIYVVYTRIQ